MGRGRGWEKKGRDESLGGREVRKEIRDSGGVVHWGCLRGGGRGKDGSGGVIS